MKLLSLFFMLFVACSQTGEKSIDNPKFVSLSPSVTEVFISLGITDNLIGVTKFCKYEEVSDIEIVGGILDPSIEKIVSLNPDYILIHPGQSFKEDIKKSKKITVEQNSISSIYNSVRKIGELAATIPTLVIQRDSLFLDTISQKHNREMSALIIVSTNAVNRDNVNFFAASSGSYLSDVFAMFGVENVLTKKVPEYASLGVEEIVELSPDVIIDVSYTESAADYLAVLPFEVQFLEFRGRHATIPGPISLKKLVTDIDSTLNAFTK